MCRYGLLAGLVFLTLSCASAPVKPQAPETHRPTVTADAYFNVLSEEFTVSSRFLPTRNRKITVYLPYDYDGRDFAHLTITVTAQDTETPLEGIYVAVSRLSDTNREFHKVKKIDGETRSASSTATIMIYQGIYKISVYSVNRKGEVSLTNELPPVMVLKQDVKQYPVLILNDGNSARQLRLEETMGRLRAYNQSAPFIAVAVPPLDRANEYGTFLSSSNILCQPEAGQYVGNKAVEYASFIVKELLPAVRKRYRASDKTADTAILGFSQGGLSAFSIAWNQPQVFGYMGAFSGSFWWRTSVSNTQARQDSRIALQMVHKTTLVSQHFHQKYFFQAATGDETADRDKDGIIDSIDDTVDLTDAMIKKGLKNGEQVVYRQTDGKHDFSTWSEVLPEFLIWIFPPHRLPDR